jgi:Lrp/AsnC family transcriptional regulator, regulator for asnA, asnC and gidA
MNNAEETAVHLDELDFLLLMNLQKDGRKSLTDLAEELNISVGTVRNRINKLIEDNTLLIMGRVNPVKVGFNAYAQLLISIRPITKVEQVANSISNLEEISFLASTTGPHDLEANLMCRNNQHLNTAINRIQKISGVFSIQTNMYFKVFKIAQPDLKLVWKPKPEEKNELGWANK